MNIRPPRLSSWPHMRANVSVVLLVVLVLGLSCARQQDEVLAQPKEPQTQQSEQQK